MKKEKKNLLQTVGSLIEEAPAEEKPAESREDAKPETPKEAPAAPNRNRALIYYITLLFAAAFLLVLGSLVGTLIQQHNSNQTINQANQNASSAISHAEQLQNDNRKLMEDLADLQSQLDEQEDTLDALTEQLDKATAELQTASEEYTQKSAEAEQALAAEKENAAQALAAYEKLLAAQDCLNQELIPDFEQAMAELEPMKGSLNERGLAVYEELFSHIQIAEDAE